MALLGGIGKWLRDQFDNIGSAVTGQPAHGPATPPQPAAPSPQAPQSPYQSQTPFTNSLVGGGFKPPTQQPMTPGVAPILHTAGNVAQKTIVPALQQANRAATQIYETPVGRLFGPSQSSVIEHVANGQQNPNVANAVRQQGYQHLLDQAGIGINDTKSTIFRKSVSDIGGTAANFIPVGQTAKVIGGGVKPTLISLASAANKSGLASAAAGGLSEARDSNDIPQIAKSAAMNYGVGAALPVAGAAARGAGAQLLKILNRGDTKLGGPNVAGNTAPSNALRLSPSSPPYTPSKPIKLSGSKLPEVPLRETEKASPANNTLVPSTKQFDSQEYVKQLTQQQEQARQGEQPGVKGRLINIKNDLRSKFVDSFAPIEDVVNNAKRNGANIAPENNITYAIDRAVRADTIAGQYIKDNGLDKIIQNAPDAKALDQYMLAKHVQDLEANGTKTGRDLGKDQQLINALHDQYEPHAQLAREYQNKLLDKTADYGLISHETPAQLKQQYPNYVPSNRIFSEEEQAGRYQGSGSGKASISNQTVVQKIKGSNREIESPLASILNKTQDVIAQGERNNAARILASYKDLPGNPFQLRELAPEEAVGTRPVVSHFDNGRQVRYETTPEVAAAAKSLNKEQMGLIGKIFSYPTRVLRLGATSLNPAFALTNLDRDLATAIINSSHPLRSSVANPKVFIEALKAATNHGSEQYAELVREGAGGTSFDIARDQPVKTVQIIRANKNIGTRAVYQLQHPIRSVGDFITAAENTIGRTEELTRAMQYFGNKQAQIKLGKSEGHARLIAADAARNNTVNFARAGEYGRVLNGVLPYLNAGIQGSRTLLRNLRERPLQTATKIAITGFLPVAVATAWNLNDPERKKAYDSIKDYEKQNNIIIIPPHPTQDPKTGRWNVIKIPVSQEIANLNNIVRNGVEALHKDKSFNFGALASDLAGTATSLNVGSTRQALNQVTPQAVKPLVEGATNQNLFTGNQIVPDAQKNLAAKDQFNKSTSGTARVIGSALGISPLQIDNLIHTTTGGLGQNIVNATDKALAAGGAIKQSDVKGTPFLQAVGNRFNSAAGTTPGSEYFTNLQDEAKNQHLSGKNYQLLNALTSKETDQNGNAVPTDITTKLENSAIRASNPDILAVETAAARRTALQTGKPLDPFYNLTPDQQKTAVVIEARKALDNSDEQAVIMKERNPWINQFYKDRSAYFQTTMGNSTATKGSLVMPTVSPQVASAMDGAKGLAGADYPNYIKQHPELSDYYTQLDKAVRAQHDYFNEPQYKAYPTPSVRVQQMLDASSSLAGTQHSAIFKDPEVSNYLADIAMWQLNKGASKAQYEGQDYTQKDLKNLYSIGNYDVKKLANGQYAQVAGTLSNGQALAGNGYSTGGTAGYTSGTAPGGGGFGGGHKKAPSFHMRRAKPIRINHAHHMKKIGLTKPPSPIKIRNKVNKHVGIKRTTYL